MIGLGTVPAVSGVAGENVGFHTQHIATCCVQNVYNLAAVPLNHLF
jgi:hypothetical protein